VLKKSVYDEDEIRRGIFYIILESIDLAGEKRGIHQQVCHKIHRTQNH
jgi:hypothetical protein